MYYGFHPQFHGKKKLIQVSNSTRNRFFFLKISSKEVQNLLSLQSESKYSSSFWCCGRCSTVGCSALSIQISRGLEKLHFYSISAIRTDYNNFCFTNRKDRKKSIIYIFLSHQLTFYLYWHFSSANIDFFFLWNR